MLIKIKPVRPILGLMLITNTLSAAHKSDSGSEYASSPEPVAHKSDSDAGSDSARSSSPDLAGAVWQRSKLTPALPASHRCDITDLEEIAVLRALYHTQKKVWVPVDKLGKRALRSVLNIKKLNGTTLDVHLYNETHARSTASAQEVIAQLKREHKDKLRHAELKKRLAAKVTALKAARSSSRF